VSEKRQKGLFNTDVKGILAALGAGICWGITPVLIKPAIGEIGSPLAAAFISYSIASLVIAFLFFRQQHREQISKLPLVTVLVPLIIGAIFASAGQLLNYAALGYSPASLVTPLLSTQILFIFLFSLLLNRRSEVFTPKIVVGMATIIAGIFLLFR
jgi:drug/metabolite transporter (DMT)-like permease